MKQIVRQILLGLDCLHRICGVAHTGNILVEYKLLTANDMNADLAPTNILVDIQDQTLIPKYLEDTAAQQENLSISDDQPVPAPRIRV